MCHRRIYLRLQNIISTMFKYAMLSTVRAIYMLKYKY